MPDIEKVLADLNRSRITERRTHRDLTTRQAQERARLEQQRTDLVRRDRELRNRRDPHNPQSRKLYDLYKEDAEEHGVLCSVLGHLSLTLPGDLAPHVGEEHPLLEVIDYLFENDYHWNNTADDIDRFFHEITPLALPDRLEDKIDSFKEYVKDLEKLECASLAKFSAFEDEIERHNDEVRQYNRTSGLHPTRLLTPIYLWGRISDDTKVRTDVVRRGLRISRQAENISAYNNPQHSGSTLGAYLAENE